MLLTVLPRYIKVSWGACSLISRLQVLSILIKSFHKLSFKNVLYMTQQNNFFLACLNWLVTCFRFQNMFWKNINCFRFWWKTYAKRWTCNYVLPRVKGLSSPALCGWSGACNLRVWFGKRNIAPILISLYFCLLCWLKKHLFCTLSLL